MKFTKMHGLGNDYLYVFGPVPENIVPLSVKLSDRHFGAGSDGMIYIDYTDNADFSMRIFNADGSEAKMCGNGIRCVGKYVYDKGYTDKTFLSIDTLSGIKYVKLNVSGGKVRSASVEMGKTVVSEDAEIELARPSKLAETDPSNYVYPAQAEWTEESVKIVCTPVSVGNPHAVIFVKDMEKAPLYELGPVVEHHPFFPEGVNTEFIECVGVNELRMRVWERGSAVTMACGTGACASVSAAASKGIVAYNTPVTVHLDGGDLVIEVRNDGSVLMTGPAESVYDAETDVLQ